MKTKSKFVSVLTTVFLAVTLLVPGSALASGTVIYDSIPDPLPPNLPSLGYQATQTSEFGDHIIFAGTERKLNSVTVTMSNWALNSTYPDMDAAGFIHPITLNIYEVDNTGATPAIGALVTSLTQDFLIPWRPEADPTCPGGTAWRASNGNCYNGYAVNIVFDFSTQNITLPDEIIYGLAYNTNTWGDDPIGEHGPYESLNFALSAANSVGTNVDPDDVFWDTETAGWYTDGGAGGVGIFRRDTNWTGLVPAIRFSVADNQGPITTNVAASQNPATVNSSVTVMASVDDASTGGSNIASAEYSFDGGSTWSPMTSTDGAFDEVIEDITANFTAPSTADSYDLCVRGTDVWGNLGSATCVNFRVGYKFTDFFQPIDMTAVNIAKAGQTVPVKWRLTDANGVPVSDPASFIGLYSYSVNCTDFTGVLTDTVETYSGSSGLQYLGDGYWQFNWKTPKAYANTCRSMYVMFQGNFSSLQVDFKFKP